MRREGWRAIRVLTALVLCTWQVSAWAQSGGSLPVLVGSGSSGTSFSVPIQTLLFFTALSFLPAILLMEVLGAVIATVAIYRAGESSKPWAPLTRSSNNGENSRES